MEVLGLARKQREQPRLGAGAVGARPVEIKHLVEDRAWAALEEPFYEGRWARRFGAQVRGALGCAVGEPGWERMALAGLEETVERLAVTRGLARWEP